MFGFKIVKEERLKELEKAELTLISFERFHWWFTGWPHVHRLLNKFIKDEVGSTNIWEVREEFAQSMNTDKWGKTPPATEEQA